MPFVAMRGVHTFDCVAFTCRTLFVGDTLCALRIVLTANPTKLILCAVNFLNVGGDVMRIRRIEYLDQGTGSHTAFTLIIFVPSRKYGVACKAINQV